MMTYLLTTVGCKNEGESVSTRNNENFSYFIDRFADVEVLRYQVPGFEELTLQQKKYIYYLSQAAVEGRDILFDQNNQYNLQIRKTLEIIYLNYKGDRDSEDFRQFEIYLKRIWFSNGIHHHYGMDKFVPGFSQDFIINELKNLPVEVFGSNIPVINDDELVSKELYLKDILLPVIFDPSIDAKRVNQAEGKDLIQTSANNYYHSYYHSNLTQQEVEDFYNAKRDPNDLTPVSYGLNSQLVKNETGNLEEFVWKIGGMYSTQIEKIVYWLEKAKAVAENEQQKNIISLLIDYYTTGDLKTFDEYSIAWVKDTASHIDFVNGFIETYGDPLGIKASWESIVNFKNVKATKRTEIISQNAQWFEDNSPVDKRFKKKEVKGVSAKVITAAMLGGDCFPPTPIGINLPNSNWIRQMHGSKSVTIENITDAYDKASKGNGFAQEFVWSEEEVSLLDKYGFVTGNIEVDLHECLGHGSGQLLPGVSQDALKAYGATIEETRADLFALYYLADEKMVELGLLPDKEAYKAEYYHFMMNGLMTQLVRIELGSNVEESHMRNRALIAHWVFQEASNEIGRLMSTKNVSPGYKIPPAAVELVENGGKTFVKINDYEALRRMFGKLLAEIQRIKSEGDFGAAQKLVEDFGVKINRKIHTEVLDRYQKLNLAPYKGFVNPVYTPVLDEKGEITDVKIEYNEGFTEQMLRYSKEYSGQ